MTARRQQAKFAAKLESLRAVIDAQQPHVLALQEVGSESALGKLQAALEHKLPHRAVAEPDERGIRVAIISRRVLHDPVEIRPFPAGLLPVQVGDDPPGPDGPRMMNQMGRCSRQDELIDHIFVSNFLVTGTTVRCTTVNAAAGMPSIEDDPSARQGKPGSDHAAVVATFDF